MARTKATQEALADRMAALIARGASQADAYRAIKPKVRKQPAQDIADRASKFVARYGINQRVAALRRDLRLQDIYSTQAWLEDSIKQRDQALEAGNYNAAGGYQRQIGQAVGAIGSDQTTVVLTDRMSDTDIIKRLASSNPQLASVLADMLGTPISSETRSETRRAPLCVPEIPTQAHKRVSH